MILGQLGLNFDFTDFLFFLVLVPILTLLGSMFGTLAIHWAIDGKSRNGPLILAALAIGLSLLTIVFYLIYPLLPCFTCVAIIPGLLGLWALHICLTRIGDSDRPDERESD
jgi:hypothetical protein